jgi:hypothetical protein
MLYFHPWEFDADQRHLPLRGLSWFRTYVGMRSSRTRLKKVLARYRFVRAIDAAILLRQQPESLPVYSLTSR